MKFDDDIAYMCGEWIIVQNKKVLVSTYKEKRKKTKGLTIYDE